MVAAYSTWVHFLEQNRGQNKGLNVYNILTAVIFLLNSREKAHLMNAQGIHQIPYLLCCNTYFFKTSPFMLFTSVKKTYHFTVLISNSILSIKTNYIRGSKQLKKHTVLKLPNFNNMIFNITVDTSIYFGFTHKNLW